MSFFDRQGIPESLVGDRAQAENGPGSREERILVMDKETAMKTTVIAIAIAYRSQTRITNLKRTCGYSETTRLSLSIRIRPLKCIHWCNWLRENGWRPMGSSKYGYSWRKGSITEAVDLSEIAMKMRKKRLGQEHKETLGSMGMLSLAYGLGARWKEAEELEVRVMETRKRVLGEKHPDTLGSMNNLAEVLSRQGKYEEAEEMHGQALALTEKVLRKEHPSTLTSMNNLAEVLSRQGH